MKRFVWKSYGLTDMGIVRKRNEDNLLLLDSNGLWLVADGAGGHSNGHIASQMAVDLLSLYQPVGRLGSDSRQACDLLRKANKKIIESAKENNQVSGSTASILLTDGRSAICIWTGDSPIYRFRNNKLEKLTQDHNRVEEFIAQGFSAEECEGIPVAQYLTQALGACSDLCLQTRWIDIQSQDCLIVCSDGITKELLFEDIENIVRENRGLEKSMAQSLISNVINRGARDNVTAMVVIFDEK